MVFIFVLKILLKSDSNVNEKLDVKGVILFGLIMILLFGVLIFGKEIGFNNNVIIMSFIILFVLFILFIVVEKKRD